MLTRRALLVSGVLGSCAPALVLGQTRKIRIGVLSGLPSDKSVLAPMLRKALADLGYQDGGTMQLDYRYSDTPSGAASLARELNARRCDVVFALGGETQASAFVKVRTAVPVVFIAINFDPVETGIVDSLARPGGNVTGVYIPVDALAAKRVELAREMLPKANRYLVLVDGATRQQAVAIQKAATMHRASLTIIDFDSPPYDLASAFEAGRQAGVQAVFLQVSAQFARRRLELSSLIMKHQLPAFVPEFMAGDPGSLASYSVDISGVIRRAAEFGVRILKGAKPADIPIEGPDEYELVVNLRTATALGIAVPPTVLARATRIIQ